VVEWRLSWGVVETCFVVLTSFGIVGGGRVSWYLRSFAGEAVMRARIFGWMVSAVVAASVLAGAAGAQSLEPACSMGFTSLLSPGGGGSGSTGYTATAKSTYEHQLLDGSYIRGYAVSHLARDAEGRTMIEYPVECWRDSNGGPKLWSTVRIFDPVAKSQVSWNLNDHNGDNIAQVFHIAPRKPLTPEEQASQRKRVPAQQTSAVEIKSEDLGTRTIAGVEAHGQRTTMIQPPGEVGNELPLVITDEKWYVKDVGIEVMEIRDDPRFGRNVYEVEELKVGEPDASLFGPPAGYKIEDRNAASSGVAKP
jgi:hypothetical protein